MSEPPRVLIVEARFYPDIADDLAAGAIAVLEASQSRIDRTAVPGAFELPAAISFALDGAINGTAELYDGFLALGCVIRGETDHYDIICRETGRALMDLASQNGIALGFGLLTCDTMEQARVRAAPLGKNKGADAAKACLRMIELKRAVDLQQP